MNHPTPVPSPSEATAALKAEIEKHLFTFGAGHCNLGQCADRILQAIPAAPQQPHPVSPTAQPPANPPGAECYKHSTCINGKGHDGECYPCPATGSQPGGAREALEAAKYTLELAIADVGPFDAVGSEAVQDALATAIERLDEALFPETAPQVEALPTPTKAADLIAAVHEILGNGADEKRWPPGMDDHEALWRYVDYLRAESGQVESQPAPVDTLEALEKEIVSAACLAYSTRNNGDYAPARALDKAVEAYMAAPSPNPLDQEAGKP